MDRYRVSSAIVLLAVFLSVVGGTASRAAVLSDHFADHGQPPGAGSITALTLGPDGQIYGVTCTTRLFVFSPPDASFTDKGTTPGDCPLALTWGADGLLYGGGWNRVLWSYDPGTGAFTARGQVPGNRRIIGLATGPDGDIYIGTEPQGDAGTKGRLFAFDPTTNTFTDLGGIADESSVGYGLIPGPDGKIYGGTFRGGRFFVYDPGRGTLTDKGQPIPAQWSIGALTVGTDGRIYGGTQPGARLFAYDPVSGTFSDRGQAVAGQTSIVSLVAMGSRIYGGTDSFGSGPGGHLFVYDTTTQTFTDLGVPVPGQRKVSALIVSGLIVYGGTGFGGYLFSYTPPTQSVFLPVVWR